MVQDTKVLESQDTSKEEMFSIGKGRMLWVWV